MQPEPVQFSVHYGPPISLELAKTIMTAAEAEANANNWSAVIAIVDSGGNLVMLHKLDHAMLGSIFIAQSKAETAVNCKCPTSVFGDLLAAESIELRLLSMRNLIAVEGGIPLIQNGKIIGAIGVSGMHPAQDGQIASAGAKVLDKKS
jgi:glc operon protein GlcG